MRTFIPSGGTVTRVIVSLSTAVMLSGAGVVMPLVASADHTAIHTLEQQITALMDQLNALKAAQGVPTGNCAFTRSLFQGVSGDDVKCLQQYLNSSGNQVAASGAGSPGNETMYFGSLTRAAVSKWQAANGVSPTAGYFGPISQAKYNSLVAAAPPPPPPGVPPPATPPGSGLAVSAATQPGDTLAPLNAARIPATKFTLTAASDGDVKVNSLTVERQGLATDAAISGIVLLGEDGLQIGLSKTLNANHQAVLNESITVKAGTSQTFTIGINRPSAAANAESGNIAKVALVAIDAGSSVVSGTLPIVGSPITMNGSLTIGTMTLTRGVNDPGSGQTKEIGTKGYIFTAIRATAGSAEDVSLKWVSFNQSGSAAATDLKNIVFNVDGTDYPTTISSDGKYYTAKFGDGIAIAKGNTKEVYVKGDIESGSNRGVDFDLYRYTDLYAVGKQFAFGITPTATDSGDSATDDDGTFQATNPTWDAYEATIGAGTLTVSKSTAIAAQNISVNLYDQPLGAFDVEAKGEPVTVASMVIRVSSNKNDDSVTEVDYSQVALHDNTTGKVVAGPLDGSGTADGQMVFTFTDSVTFPTGKRAYVLKGKLSTDFNTDTLISASTTPSTDWTSVTGSVSGASITPAPTSSVVGNNYTVKTATTTITISNTPQAQNIVAGVTGFTFANILFDATASGEDVRYTSAAFQLLAYTATDVKNCALFDGTTQLNTGSNVQNPATTGDKTFTLDNNLSIPKGTIKSIALKCDVGGNATAANRVQWSMSGNESFGATGLVSGNSFTPNIASSSVTNLMTIQTGGTLAVTLDGSSPSVRLAQGNQEVILAQLRVTGTNEALNLKQLGLQLSGTGSNTPQDLLSVSLWDGSTKVGDVFFTSTDFATGTITAFTVPKDDAKILTVKGVINTIGTNQPARSGHRVIVDWDQGAGSDNTNSGTYAVGVESSTNVYAARGDSDTASGGVRITRAYPTVNTSFTLPNTTLTDGEKSLYRFSVTAPAGTNGVALYKFGFNVATTNLNLNVTSFRVFGYSDSSFSQSAYGVDGQLNSGSTFYTTDNGRDAISAVKSTTSDYYIYFNPGAPTSATQEAITVPAGATRYFELKGTVAGTGATRSVNTRLLGDTTFVDHATTDDFTLATYGFARSADGVDFGVFIEGGSNGFVTDNNRFIWSDNATTTHSGTATGARDWFNGAFVPGLPSGGGNTQSISTP